MSAKRNSEHRLPTNNHVTAGGAANIFSQDSSSEKSELERRLRESEARFRIMFEQANVGIAFADFHGKIQQVNQRYCEIVGYPADELVGNNIDNITHPDDRVLNWAYLDALLHGNVPMSVIEKRYVRKDGSSVWASLTLSLMCDEQGKPLYYMAVIQDISSRKATEAERDRLLVLEQEARAKAEAMAQQLNILQHITDTTLAHLSLEDMLHELLIRIEDILHADTSAVLLPTEDGRYLKVRASHGLEQEVSDAIELPIGEGHAVQVKPSLEPTIIDDLSGIDIVSTLLREKVRSLITVPLLVAGNIIGLLAVGTRQTHHFTQEDGALLQRVADRMALAIDHLRLYEAERHARSEATIRAQQYEVMATEAAARASQLEAIFLSMTDAITVYDKQGNLLYASAVAEELFPLTQQPDYYTRLEQERVLQYDIRDEHGRPLTVEEWPYKRVLKGEVFKDTNALEVLIRDGKGYERQFSISGSPMRAPDGAIIGGVLISHEVTERRRLERRTHEALDGLLAMAESLVLVTEDAEGLSLVGKHLAELTRHVLDCSRVGIQTIEPETQIIRPLAVVGLSAEQERAWWEEQRQQEQRLHTNPMPELVERLRTGEVLVIDMMQPPFNAAPNPYAIKIMLVAPMCIGEQLVGLLTLDYSGESHSYSENEIALASAVAKLSALVLERQRLLRERAESAVRELALRESNSRMEEFLGVASHELRTPLTTIKANVQLAQRRVRALSQEAASLPREANTKVTAVYDMLSRAGRQIDVLNRLVGDLIDISRIQTGKLQLQVREEPCDLREVVRETVQEQRKATPERTLIFQSANTQAVPVIADPDRIMQVLTNYLTNAIKYSESDKPVYITLEVQATQARVAVRDLGPGLSLEEQGRIWECFYQAEGIRVVSGAGVGLGLGLYISQMIIQRHHGEVGVVSQRPGGSTFWFTLPLAHS